MNSVQQIQHQRQQILEEMGPFTHSLPCNIIVEPPRTPYSWDFISLDELAAGILQGVMVPNMW